MSIDSWAMMKVRITHGFAQVVLWVIFTASGKFLDAGFKPFYLF
jgi:hypothetical protein